MRSNSPYTSLLIAAVFSLTGWFSNASAQSMFDTNIGLRSVGVSVSGYSPSFDYFDQTFWDFNGGAALGFETEVSIMPVLGIKAGIGYFSTSSSVDRVEIGGEETLTYTLTPVSIGAVARYNFPEFTVSFSPGVDFYRVKSSYESDAESESTTGNITGYNLTGGIERSFGAIGIELFGKYIIGSFEQQMQFDPDEPVSTEEINLNGFAAGVMIKYLF